MISIITIQLKVKLGLVVETADGQTGAGPITKASPELVVKPLDPVS
ncbi:hypothetical protein AGMMS49940_23610 [Spirochaetia bacterium]|nr:hypothetical protein AGMMS49940_23610 [Spirochaetia bacterium]